MNWKIDLAENAYNVRLGFRFGVEMTLDEVSDLRRSLASMLRGESYISLHLDDAEMLACLVEVERWRDDRIGIGVGKAWFNLTLAEAAELLDELERML